MGVQHLNKRSFDEVALTPDAYYAAQQQQADASVAAVPPRLHEMTTRQSSGQLAGATSTSSDGDSVCSSWSSDDERRTARSHSYHRDGDDAGRRTKRRRKWGKHEDRLLRQSVADLQAPGLAAGADPKISWSAVARSIPARTAKQCRDRWNSITPGIKKREWTKEEDELLLRLYRTHKNSWVRIAREFEGRNDNMLKSRFRSLCKRKRVKDMLAMPQLPPPVARLPSLPPLPPFEALPRLPSLPLDDFESFLGAHGGVEGPPALFRGASLGLSMLPRKSSLPPRPACSVRATSGLFANLSFADGASPERDALSVGSAGEGAPPPPMDEELADWCAVMVDERVL